VRGEAKREVSPALAAGAIAAAVIIVLVLAWRVWAAPSIRVGGSRPSGRPVASRPLPTKAQLQALRDWEMKNHIGIYANHQ
jgi:hypothetical protein